MNTVGLIAEYNPFHNGHALHLSKAKSVTGCPHSVVVMSGNFVQRGEPAIVDKGCRVKMALRSGADVVIELPVCYATASAEVFARGAVRLLRAAGIVTDICFGSECGELAPLQAAADALAREGQGFRQTLKNELGKGLSFPAARHRALLAAQGERAPAPPDLATSPNNILAVCYLKELAKQGGGIRAHTIKREYAQYHDTRIHPVISSASAIRRNLTEGRMDALAHAMPGDCPALLREKLRADGAARLNNLSHLLHYSIKSHDRQWLKSIQDVSEGLENRILDVAGRAYYIDHIITQIKTKRYTMAKIRRILLHCILNMSQEEFLLFEKHGGPRYIRVLGFRKSKAFLLREIKDNARLPLLTNIKRAPEVLDPIGMAMLSREIETTDAYYLSTDGYKENPRPRHAEYTQPVIVE